MYISFPRRSRVNPQEREQTADGGEKIKRIPYYKYDNNSLLELKRKHYFTCFFIFDDLDIFPMLEIAEKNIIDIAVNYFKFLVRLCVTLY